MRKGRRMASPPKGAGCSKLPGTPQPPISSPYMGSDQIFSTWA
jgi:hypothetical protein